MHIVDNEQPIRGRGDGSDPIKWFNPATF